MILYLDTSSLVKIYVEESHSDEVRRWLEDAAVVATSVVAYPEAAAAFARRRREGVLEANDLERVLAALDADWSGYAVVEVQEREAGALAVKHGLRGFDAVHLEAALTVKVGADAAAVAFSSFDSRLNQAAREEGLAVLEAPQPLEPQTGR